MRSLQAFLPFVANLSGNASLSILNFSLSNFVHGLCLLLTPSRFLLHLTTADLDIQNLAATFSNDTPCFVFLILFSKI
ncbi:hypothetical protein K737_301055 [Holospora undulata HU1]|uniref:Uncharacterized protein n=1 Tax=Holospora undulata HU1 TaxID=1321371 RepID=A0A061JHW8_9PROT|nr:hypothetical protein K737_301055 [Holospora undulata HU1]